MTSDSFETTMGAVHELFAAERFETALTRAAALRSQLLGGPIVEAEQLGWAMYYELRCLHQLERTKQAWELVTSDWFAVGQPGPKNKGWMCSVAAEMAARMERSDEVVTWGQECYFHRFATDDAPSQMNCCDTVCTLLERLGRADLNGDFALELVRIGREHEAVRPALRGIDRLLDNLAMTDSEPIRNRLLDSFGEVARIGTEGYERELLPVLTRATTELGLAVKRLQDGSLAPGPAVRYQPYREAAATLWMRAMAQHLDRFDRHEVLTVAGFEKLSILLQKGFRNVCYDSYHLPPGLMFWITDEHARAIGDELHGELECFHLALTTFEGAGFDLICDAVSDCRVGTLVVNHRSGDEVTAREAAGLARLVTKLRARKLSLWAAEFDSDALAALAAGLKGNRTLTEADLCDTTKPEPEDRIEVPAIERIAARNCV